MHLWTTCGIIFVGFKNVSKEFASFVRMGTPIYFVVKMKRFFDEENEKKRNKKIKEKKKKSRKDI